MRARIDHVSSARSHMRTAVAMANAGNADGARVELQLAQVDALLAQVEQMRIENLIALGQFRVGVNDLPHLRHLAIEPKNEHDVQPVADIREALGLA